MVHSLPRTLLSIVCKSHRLDGGGRWWGGGGHIGAMMCNRTITRSIVEADPSRTSPTVIFLRASIGDPVDSLHGRTVVYGTSGGVGYGLVCIFHHTRNYWLSSVSSAHLSQTSHCLWEGLPALNCLKTKHLLCANCHREAQLLSFGASRGNFALWGCCLIRARTVHTFGYCLLPRSRAPGFFPQNWVLHGCCGCRTAIQLLVNHWLPPF